MHQVLATCFKITSCIISCSFTNFKTILVSKDGTCTPIFPPTTFKSVYFEMKGSIAKRGFDLKKKAE